MNQYWGFLINLRLESLKPFTKMISSYSLTDLFSDLSTGWFFNKSFLCYE